jgi:hypothetical protein
LKISHSVHNCIKIEAPDRDFTHISSDTGDTMAEVVQEQSGLLLADVKSSEVVLQANGEARGARSGEDGSSQGQGHSQDDVLELHCA